MTNSSTNHNLKTPDFKVSTRYFDVEHAPKWGRLGECGDYFWKTPNETTKESKKKESCSTPCQSKLSDAAVDTVSKDECGDDVACLLGNWQKQKTTERLDGEPKKKKISTDIDDLFDR